MKHRKALALLALGLVLCLALPGMASAQTSLTFAFWGSADEIKLKQQLTDLYMAENPDVKIEGTYTEGGQYPAKLQTWFASNTAPDVMGIACDIIYPYLDLGVFEDLQPYMERDGLLAESWSPTALDVFKDAQGRVLAAPYIYKAPAVVYNKALFDQVGLAYPQAGWTEAQLLEMAQKLTTGSGRNKVFGIRLGTWPNRLMRNLYGEAVYDVNAKAMNAAGNEQFKAGLELFVSMIRDLGVAPDDAMAEAVGGGFETGKYAMALTAPWDMESFAKLIGTNFEWDVVSLPVSEKWGPWLGNLYADGYAVSSASANKEAAWAYVKWLTSDVEAQTLSAQIGIPMLVSLANSDAYLSTYTGEARYDKLAFVEMLDRGTSWQSSGVWAKINDEIINQYKMVLSGKQDVDTAIANIQAAGEKILAE